MLLACAPREAPPEVRALREGLAIPAAGIVEADGSSHRLTVMLATPDHPFPADGLALAGGRQEIRDEGEHSVVLRVLVEPVDARHLVGDRSTERSSEDSWLGSGAGMDLQDAGLRRLAANLDPTTTRRAAVEALDRQLARDVRVGWRREGPNAAAALRAGRAECLERSLIGAAVLRLAGVPARPVLGLAHRDGRFVYHAWVEYDDGRWSTWDPTWRLHPAPATHLRLAVWDTPSVSVLREVLAHLRLEAAP